MVSECIVLFRGTGSKVCITPSSTGAAETLVLSQLAMRLHTRQPVKLQHRNQA
jgi:hypothetical protein